MATEVHGGGNFNSGIGHYGEPDDDKGAHDRAKDDKKQKNPKPMNPDNPTVASTDGSKTILDSIKQADPGNVSGFIQKAVDAMMQIRSIDAAGGMGGGAGGGGGGGGGGGTQTQAAAMGRGLIDARKLLEAAQQLTLREILDALNAIMPEVIPQLSAQEVVILDQAILAIITDTNVGVLSPVAVQAAEATAAAITQVQSLSSVSTNQEIIAATMNAAETIGGPTLNMDPHSLAYMILQAAVGTTLINTIRLNSRLVEMTVHIDSSYIMDQLADMPTFTGTEQQTIAEEEAETVTNELVDHIVNDTLTATNFLTILRNMQANVQNKAMRNAVGFDMGSLLNNVMSIISQFASNITDSKEDHQPRGRLETVSDALEKHTRILGLIKKKLDASDIFSGMGSGGGNMSQAASMMSSMMSALGGGGGSGASAIAGSAISQAMNASNIIPMTTSVTSVLNDVLQAGQNPTQYLTGAAIDTMVSNGGAMLNTLTSAQVQSMLSTLPPSLVMSMMGSGLTIFANMNTQELDEVLRRVSPQTVLSLLQGMPSTLNYTSSGTTLAEHTSDIAAALAVVLSTQDPGTFLKAILPNGTTVTCSVIVENSFTFTEPTI